MAVKNYMINDKWLDIAKQNIVEVESSDGVIGSVKVNGQEYGGGGGSSDFSTAEVIITNNASDDATLEGAVNINNDMLYTHILVEKDETMTRTAVLYKNEAYWFEGLYSVAVTGNAAASVLPYGGTEITITGDCTITLTGGQPT